MRVFVTGATGFIGSATVQELLHAGHRVLGLARSDAGAQSLIAAGAEVHRGDLEDLDSLRGGAAAADAVIHTAFIHDFSRFQQNCEIDRRAIEALGDALMGSNKLLIVTSGTGISAAGPGQPATETDPPVSSNVVPRGATEEAAATAAARGVRGAMMRLPQVHDTVKQGLVTYAIHVAREKGVAAYIGDGLNRWPAAHVLDTAHLYRLALEKDNAGIRYHAVLNRECPSGRSLRQSVGACAYRQFPSRRKQRPNILAGSRHSPHGTFRLPARKRGKRWVGTPRGPVSSRILKICAINPSESST